MTEITTYDQTLTFLGINLGYALIALFISVLALIIIDKYLFRRVDFIDEIKKGNIAASIFYSVLLLFIGIVIATVLK